MAFTHPSGHFDNAARAYAYIEARPLASAMGAEIRGVDFREVEDALFRHMMIFFRDQQISRGDQEASV